MLRVGFGIVLAFAPAFRRHCTLFFNAISYHASRDISLSFSKARYFELVSCHYNYFVGLAH